MRRFACTVLLAVASACSKPAPSASAPPPEVYAASVVQKDVPQYLDLIGQTEGYQDVDIRARVEGFLQSVDFREGSFVRKGDLLYEIDPKPLQAALDAANADKATAEARLTKTTNDVVRYTPLVAKQAVSRQELDDARSARVAAQSQVEAAQAAVEKATLDLGYTRVRSPINGLVGVTQVKPGNLVGRGQATLLTTVSQIDPILFNVNVTETDFLRIARRFRGQLNSTPKTSGIVLTLADGTEHPYTGRVNTIERAVNPETGTIGVKLEFPNPGFLLRPGQFGRARVLTDTLKGALLVPQRAVQEMQNLYSVATVGPDNKITFRTVTVGPRVGSLWVIERGLKPGDRVVAEGLQRIREGLTVRAVPFTEPGAPQPVATAGQSR